MPIQTHDMENSRVVSPQSRRASSISGSKIAAVVAWIGAVYTTYLSVQALQMATPWHIAIATAVVIQFVLTMAERPILSGKPQAFTLVVCVFDTLINAGGVFPTLRNVANSPTAQMFAATGTPATVGTWPALIISLVVGAIIAIAPEALWRME